jgi:hypothetical protein
MVYVISFLVLFSFFNSFAKDYNYQIKGSFQSKATEKKSVDFTLRWNEEKGKIDGVYSDNFYIKNAEVSGTQGEMGRNFQVKFPEENESAKTINILTSSSLTKRTGTTIPVSIIIRDKIGKPLLNVDSDSRFTATHLVAQKQEEECREGFGALGGFCGVYAGLISEQVDRQNRCNLLFADAIRMELDNEANIRIYLGQVDEILRTPEHLVGKLPPNPSGTEIDISSRSCKQLAGIRSVPKSCKRLNLSGDFSMMGSNQHFKGVYTIYDESTKNTCSYILSMGME